MELVFVCPEIHTAFRSEKYTIIDNRGIKTDAAGNRTLDATVKLDTPCPYCSRKHVFHVNELACPFSG